MAEVRKPWTKRYVVPRATRVLGSKVDDTNYSSLLNEQMRIYVVLINLKACMCTEKDKILAAINEILCAYS